MDSPYEKLDENTRQEWREHPTTVAFLSTVAAMLGQSCTLALDTLACGGFGRDGGAAVGGAIQAYRYVLDIAQRRGKASDE